MVDCFKDSLPSSEGFLNSDAESVLARLLRNLDSVGLLGTALLRNLDSVGLLGGDVYKVSFMIERVCSEILSSRFSCLISFGLSA